MSRPAALALGLAALCACGPPAPRSAAERTVEDKARGVRYVVPQRWASWDGEIRSPEGSLLTLRVHELEGADPRFVTGLPDTLFPQLLEWTKWYYVVDGAPTRKETMIAGLPAIELTYPIRIRPKDPPSRVSYWVVRRGSRLFVIRAAYPPGALAKDEPEVRKVLASWDFLATPAGPPPP